MKWRRKGKPVDMEISGTELLQFVDQALAASRASADLILRTAATMRALSQGVPVDFAALARMADAAEQDAHRFEATNNALEAAKLALLPPRGQA